MPQFSVSLDKVVEKLRLEVVYTPHGAEKYPYLYGGCEPPGPAADRL